MFPKCFIRIICSQIKDNLVMMLFFWKLGIWCKVITSFTLKLDLSSSAVPRCDFADSVVYPEHVSNIDYFLSSLEGPWSSGQRRVGNPLCPFAWVGNLPPVSVCFQRSALPAKHQEMHQFIWMCMIWRPWMAMFIGQADLSHRGWRYGWLNLLFLYQRLICSMSSEQFALRMSWLEKKLSILYQIIFCPFNQQIH